MKSRACILFGDVQGRLPAIALAGALMFGLAACGQEESTQEDEVTPEQDMSQMDDHDMSNMPADMDMSKMGDHDMSNMPAGMDMSKMDMSDMDMSDMMTQETYATLRDRVPNYREFTDEQILLEMQMMGGNDWRYLSPEGKSGKTGVLVLIHGFGPTGDRIMREAVTPLGKIFPTAIAAGMSMMNSAHIQSSMDQLAEAGAESVVVVPLSSTRYNSLVYQWEHVFGKRDHGSFLDVPQVETDAKLDFVTPIEDHPLAHEILLDHAKDLSTDPANELVIIVAHGPHWEEENKINLEILGRLATRIQDIGGFSDVKALTLQDDAPSAVRAANVERLRAMVNAADDEGKDVIIVTNLLSARSIQWKIERDLEGLDYKFSVKGISEHPNFAVWLREEVMESLKSQPAN